MEKSVDYMVHNFRPAHRKASPALVENVDVAAIAPHELKQLALITTPEPVCSSCSLSMPPR